MTVFSRCGVQRTVLAIAVTGLVFGAAPRVQAQGPQVSEAEKALDGVNDGKASEGKPRMAANEDLKKHADLAMQLQIMNEQLETLRKQVAAMQTGQRDLELLQNKVSALESDTGAFANRLHELEIGGGDESMKSLLGTMNTDLEARRELQRAMYVNAAVRLYNWEGKPASININGTWQTLKKGENNILVPYGPVTVRRWEDRQPRIFTDWKPFKSGFIMEFDVGLADKGK